MGDAYDRAIIALFVIGGMIGAVALLILAHWTLGALERFLDSPASTKLFQVVCAGGFLVAVVGFIFGPNWWMVICGGILAFITFQLIL